MEYDALQMFVRNELRYLDFVVIQTPTTAEGLAYDLWLSEKLRGQTFLQTFFSLSAQRGDQ